MIAFAVIGAGPAAGGQMAFVQFPYEVLSKLGLDLNTVATQLGEKQHGAVDCAGLGSDQGDIQAAIEHFRKEWKTSVEHLVTDIGKWGGLSKAIGDMLDQFDTQVAAALAPGATGLTGPSSAAGSGHAAPRRAATTGHSAAVA